MPANRARFLALLIGLGLGATTVAEAQTFICVPGGGNDMGLAVRRRIVQVVTAPNDTASNADRAMFNLPKTTESKVSTVISASKCVTAAQNFLTATGRTPAPTDTLRFLYLKVGSSRLVVAEVTIKDGPPGLIEIFDSKWRHQASVAY